MKELLTVVNGMEKTLDALTDRYDPLPPQLTYLGGVALDEATVRLRTGSIASQRSRSNSVAGKERSRHASISE